MIIKATFASIDPLMRVSQEPISCLSNHGVRMQSPLERTRHHKLMKQKGPLVKVC